MSSPPYLLTTLAFLATFICAVHMVEVPSMLGSINEDALARNEDQLDLLREASLAKTKRSADAVVEVLEYQLEGMQVFTEVRSAESQHDDLEKRDEVAKKGIMAAANFLGQCARCPRGGVGPAGVVGVQGKPGRDGRIQGIEKPFELKRTKREVPTAATEDQNATKSKYAAVTYTRWGRSDCPSMAELVYSGIVAGSHYNHKGSGVNYLCLPLEPQFGPDTGTTGSAYIYGLEYETNVPNNQGILNSEVPCAVCVAKGRQTVLTIPAKNECVGPLPWTLEYRGYMMSSSHSYHKSEYICVDGDAQGVKRSSFSNDEARLYTAEARCSLHGGGMPCPPYATGFDVLCVVCTL